MPCFFETLFAAEIEQVDNERSVSHFTTQTTDQFNGRFDSAAGCQQIVHHQNFVARFDGINVDLQLIGAVFRVVSFTDGFTRQLCPVYGPVQKANAQTQSYRSAKQEATRFGADNFGNARRFL